MAIVAAFDLEVKQYDAVNAFANANLLTEIGAKCAEGYEEEGKILWVHKALYGLKESPLLWYKHLTATLEELGFWSVPDTNCIFVSEKLILIFYVDDILVLYHSKDKHLVDEFELNLLKRYEVRVIGEAEHFLGVRILRDRENRKLWLLQDSYIDKIAEKFNITPSAYPVRTPLTTEELVPYDDIATPEQIHYYQHTVGTLNYPATITRPDIAKSLSKLSEFL